MWCALLGLHFVVADNPTALRKWSRPLYPSTPLLSNHRVNSNQIGFVDDAKFLEVIDTHTNGPVSTTRRVRIARVEQSNAYILADSGGIQEAVICRGVHDLYPCLHRRTQGSLLKITR
jgi:hypothetical protein